VLNETPVVVFLKPGDFTVAEITKLRVDLSLINSGAQASSPSAEEINDAARFSTSSRPRLMFLRPGLLRPVFRQLPHIPSSTVLKALEDQGGNIAILTMDSLHPPTLKAALAAVKKLSSSPNVRKLQAAATAAAAAGGAGKGGKGAAIAARPAAGATKAEERIPVITAVIENRELGTADLARIADLPSMDEILAQLVGLIELPARSIISMASRAGGEDLVRTLEGFKVGLEKQQEASAGSESAPAA
jgi:ribosomal protein L10